MGCPVGGERGVPECGARSSRLPPTIPKRDSGTQICHCHNALKGWPNVPGHATMAPRVLLWLRLYWGTDDWSGGFPWPLDLVMEASHEPGTLGKCNCSGTLGNHIFSGIPVPETRPLQHSRKQKD